MIKMQFRPDGLYMKHVCPANIQLVSVFVPKTCFKPYNIEFPGVGVEEPYQSQAIDYPYTDITDDGETVSVGICIGEIARTLRPEVLRFGDLVKYHDGTLQCGIYTKKLEDYDPTLEKGYRSSRIPKIDLPVSFMIRTKLFRDVIKTAGERFRIAYQHSGCQVCILDDSETGVYDLSNCVYMKSMPDSADTSTFSSLLGSEDHDMPELIKHLSVITDDIQVSFGSDYPLELRVKDKFGTEYFMLFAPRIESH